MIQNSIFVYIIFFKQNKEKKIRKTDHDEARYRIKKKIVSLKRQVLWFPEIKICSIKRNILKIEMAFREFESKSC